LSPSSILSRSTMVICAISVSFSVTASRPDVVPGHRARRRSTANFQN
jgi:hypothetical protein